MSGLIDLLLKYPVIIIALICILSVIFLIISIIVILAVSQNRPIKLALEKIGLLEIGSKPFQKNDDQETNRKENEVDNKRSLMFPSETHDLPEQLLEKLNQMKDSNHGGYIVKVTKRETQTYIFQPAEYSLVNTTPQEVIRLAPIIKYKRPTKGANLNTST